MTFADPQPIASSVLAEVAASVRQGLDHDEIIARMRALGLHKIDCIKLFREYGGVSLGSAKHIVHLSPVWADRYASDEAFHDSLEAAAEITFAQEHSAA